MAITFNADLLREVAAAAGDETLEQIAERTGLDVSQLSRLFAGKRQPMFATAFAAAAAYGKSANEFANTEVAA